MAKATGQVPNGKIEVPASWPNTVLSSACQEFMDTGLPTHQPLSVLLSGRLSSPRALPPTPSGLSVALWTTTRPGPHLHPCNALTHQLVRLLKLESRFESNYKTRLSRSHPLPAPPPLRTITPRKKRWRSVPTRCTCCNGAKRFKAQVAFKLSLQATVFAVV